MRKDKELVISLRKKGKSYKEIKELMGVPKSTLSGWLHAHKWSQDMAKNLSESYKDANIVRFRELNRIKGEHLRRVYTEAGVEAREEFEVLKYHPLFIASISVYWSEGDRLSKHGVSISNTDPAMIKLFSNFLLHICQIPIKKLRAGLYIYPDLIDSECKKYWIECAGLRYDMFIKSVILPNRGSKRRLKYGVCKVGCSSSYLKRKVDIWLKLFSKETDSAAYYNRAEVV